MNPGAKAGRGCTLWPKWQAELTARNISFDTVTTESPEHATKLAAEASNYDTVVAVGGDGTINRVLDGVLQSGRTDLRMGVLYAGTSPDFCRFHNIPVNPGEATEVLATETTAKVDVVRIKYYDANNAERLAHFGCGSNIGLGAAVASAANRLRRFTGDLPGTCLAAIYSILTTPPRNLTITVDGKIHHLNQVNNLSILKNPFIASGLRLNLDLYPDDGKLMLVVVQGRTRFSLLSLLPAFYSGRAIKQNDVFTQACSSIRISDSDNTPVEFDGDPRGFLPVEITILPGMLTLISKIDPSQAPGTRQKSALHNSARRHWIQE